MQICCTAVGQKPKKCPCQRFPCRESISNLRLDANQSCMYCCSIQHYTRHMFHAWLLTFQSTSCCCLLLKCMTGLQAIDLLKQICNAYTPQVYVTWIGVIQIAADSSHADQVLLRLRRQKTIWLSASDHSSSSPCTCAFSPVQERKRKISCLSCFYRKRGKGRIKIVVKKKIRSGL